MVDLSNKKSKINKMGYGVALNKAWESLLKLNVPKVLSVKFLGDEYSVDFAARKIYSLSCNVPAKDFAAILILHYLSSKSAGLPQLDGQWQDFRELSGVEGYADAYRKRCIEPVLRKYGNNPAGIFEVTKRLPAKKIEQADAAVVVEVFEGVPALVEIWAGDDEFSPEANMLFDKSIAKIFCIEDVVVIGGFVASAL